MGESVRASYCQLPREQVEEGIGGEYEADRGSLAQCLEILPQGQYGGRPSTRNREEGEYQ